MSGKKQIAHSALLVLSLLSVGDMYGYQMIVELERRSDKTFQMKEGTLYPVLKQLENGKYIKSYSQEYNGRLRKYYHINDSGMQMLKTEAAAWRRYSDGIDAVLGGAMVPG
ncbi:MAG: PadR family transcriptional regulator [Clostridia bacterium]|nr:PadR family transcriptional regulator [Clostridia bacterium]